MEQELKYKRGFFSVACLPNLFESRTGPDLIKKERNNLIKANERMKRL